MPDPDHKRKGGDHIRLRRITTVLATLLALSSPAPALAYPDREAFSDVELTLADRLVEVRQEPSVTALTPRAAQAATTGVYGPRVKQRVREQARRIQLRARAESDWQTHDRGLRFAALRRVLFADGWRTAQEQREIDAERAAAAEKKAASSIETASDIVSLGRAMQAAGYTVGEHPAFGGLCGCHSPTGYHPMGRAVDVNADNGNEYAMLQELYERLQQNPHVVELLWQVADHFDHLHVAI